MWIIGKAAAHIYNREPTFLQQHPQLQWVQLRAMRNEVIHAYFFVDSDIAVQNIEDARGNRTMPRAR
jgi:uncharacterized protein with HEPN domain